jgi:hypothetical protein
MRRLLCLAGVCLVAGAGAAPPQVLTVTPRDGSALADVAVIGAELDFTRGARADPTSLRLSVDGVDVTARSTIRMSRDWPPSAVSIAYVPPRLRPGIHRVEARFRAAAGRTLSHRWSFTLVPARADPQAAEPKRR